MYSFHWRLLISNHLFVQSCVENWINKDFSFIHSFSKTQKKTDKSLPY